MTVVLGLAFTSLGIDNVNTFGWFALPSGGFPILGLLLIAAFAFVEVRVARDPLIHPPLLRNGPFMGLVVVGTIGNAGRIVFIVMATFELQTILGFDPAITGLLFISASVGIALSGPLSGWACSRWPAVRVMAVAAILGGGSLVLLALTTAIPLYVTALFVCGLACGMTYSVAQVGVQSAVPPQQSGEATSFLYLPIIALAGLAVVIASGIVEGDRRRQADGRRHRRGAHRFRDRDVGRRHPAPRPGAPGQAPRTGQGARYRAVGWVECPTPRRRNDYAASRRRTEAPLLQAFRERQRFDLDPFQLSACAVLEAGKSVLVAAPTGAGKTVVAEFAIFMAMERARDKVFYTTPMKALSNQKFQELVAEYGPDAVGLLTGDTNVNSGARIVVMTTEVLRNMLYADSDLLQNLSWVVMDEVHYLADRFRGAVWEEVIIHLPREVRMISLSATVSNAEEFGDWLQAVRGDTEVIVSEERPVPLDQHILVRTRLVDLFDSSGLTAANRVNPELEQLARQGGRSMGSRQHKDVGRSHSRGGRPDNGRMERPEIVRLLEGKNLLPGDLLHLQPGGLRRRRDDRAPRRGAAHHERGARRDPRDRRGALPHAARRGSRRARVLGLAQRARARGRVAPRGPAARVQGGRRGAVPAQAPQGRVRDRDPRPRHQHARAHGRARAAGEVQRRGEGADHAGEYTQLTGRAGRRGIDVEGHSVIQWIDGMDPQAVASLASRRTYPLNSSFTPTYNMAVNLIEQFGRERTREILESSFAQFQADRAVVDLARRVRSQEESMAGYEKSMTCHLGDFAEYSRIRRELTDLERKGAAQGSQSSRADRDRRQRQLTELRRQMRQHPCHACPDREAHARWAERWWRLKRDTDQLTSQIKGRTGAVARIFDRVTEVLLELGYLSRSSSGELTLEQPGRMLRRIYGERDLLVAESLRRGFWDDLDAPALAAMATTLVFEPRREEAASDEYTLPKGPIRGAFSKTSDLWATLDDLEREHHLPGSAPLATGLARPMFRWVSGSPLDLVLEDADLAAGDFVRWSKQTIDLLDQLSIVADGPVGRTARRAIDGILKGVVAYSSVL